MKDKKKVSSLFGKTVVITGASSGIGKATAEAFAKEGANLVLASRGEEALTTTAEVCRRFGSVVLTLVTDISIPEDVYQLAEKAFALNNRIDYWINNAGVLSFGKFEEMPIEVIDQIIKTNLLGYIHSAHAVLPVFKKQKKGVLINNISIGGWMPAPYGTAYTASKFGIRGMVETLQGEVSDYPDIHICALYPGFQKSSGIEHAANYSGIKLSTPPPSFDPRDLANNIVKVAKNPVNSAYPDWFSIVAKNLYTFFPGTIRNASSSLMRFIIKKANHVKDTEGNVLKPSKGNMDIDGKTLLSSENTLKIASAGIVSLGIMVLLFSLKKTGKLRPI
ncbi:SDR family oxidoreductase [Chryseobacterium joostei]|uniref:SDR family oxidoreductase n=1 Tax=Chryseobacterium joostei TaxID=112234 RepID=UPI0023EF9BB7|nr:SDR family oxidoreductase [Chryseobacterium joostei]